MNCVVDSVSLFAMGLGTVAVVGVDSVVVPTVVSIDSVVVPAVVGIDSVVVPAVVGIDSVVVPAVVDVDSVVVSAVVGVDPVVVPAVVGIDSVVWLFVPHTNHATFHIIVEDLQRRTADFRLLFVAKTQ
uniref:Uncharacterized protein n=1 Tax=Ciona savignyi TaxID=51511 RepID=H2YYH3_CIOSA